MALSCASPLSSRAGRHARSALAYDTRLHGGATAPVLTAPARASSRPVNTARSLLSHITSEAVPRRPGAAANGQPPAAVTRRPSNLLFCTSRLHGSGTYTSVVAAVGLRYIEGDTP